MAKNRLKEYLDEHHIKYQAIKHSPTFTAQETAQSAHLSGRAIAKTVIIKMNGKLAMVILSANEKINFSHLAQDLGSNKIELASEREFKDKFPECEVGAMPPFGNLYGLDVYVDEQLTHDKEIAFNAGSHSELIKMSYLDFEQSVHPRVLHAA